MTRKRHVLVALRIAGLAAVLACLAAFTYVGALHSPGPHDLDLGLVGSPSVTGPAATGITEQSRDGYDLHEYPDRAAAVAAIRDHDVAAAYLPDPVQSELLVAGANGAMQVTNVTATFERLAAKAHTSLVVTDVVPTPDGDRAGMSPFLMAVSLTVPSLALAVLTILLGSRLGLPPWGRLAVAAIGALAVALVDTAVVDFALDALTGHFWTLAGVAALAVFALASATLAVHRLLGPPGLALSFALFLVLGMPATGAAVGPAYLPDAFRWITLALPAGEAVPALRGVQYYDGADSGPALLLLAVWGVAGAVVLLSAPRRAVLRPAAARQLAG